MLEKQSSKSDLSIKRLHAEDENCLMNAYQSDRNRIIHSTAFRRLKYKTQVFVNHEGDHYRTRLTHSLEVAQTARIIACNLNLDQDLAETVALAHDLGHPPFGHAGEDALNDILAENGGFNHNDQTLKILCELEKISPDYNGLNLTTEVLESIAKHNGPLKNAPKFIAAYNESHNLSLNTYPCLEAQIAALSDDIAYNNHDIEDGLRAGIFALNELKQLEFFKDLIEHHSLKDENLIKKAIARESRTRMISDLISTTDKALKNKKIITSEDVKNSDKFLVDFSEEMKLHINQIKEFLNENMYRHYKVNRMSSKAKRIIKDLFSVYNQEPEVLPSEWRHKINEDKASQKEIIVDFIAGMTDRFAIKEFKNMFDFASI